MGGRPRRILGPALAAVVCHAGLFAAYYVRHGEDASALVCAGTDRAGLPPYRAVTRHFGPSGYDGQFYFAIAQSPWRCHEQPAVDRPAARQVRILFPAVCWLLSGGRAEFLFWVMPAVNLAALGGLAALGARLAVRFDRSAWWGFLLPLALNATMPALRNLTDPLSTLAVFGLLSAWVVGAGGWELAVWSAAAVFCREQNVVVAGLVLLDALRAGRVRLAAGLAAGLLAWAGWVTVLRGAYGCWPFLTGGGNFGPPFAGLAHRVTHLCGRHAFSWPMAVVYGASLLHLVVQGGVAVALAARPADRTVRLTMVGGMALACCAGPFIYDDFWSYTRVFVWLPIGIWVVGTSSRLRWPLFAVAPAAAWGLAAVVR